MCFSGNSGDDSLYGRLCITDSTHACRGRSILEVERPNSDATGGAVKAKCGKSSKCAVPLPYTTMDLGECHRARESHRTRLTASDKLTS